MANGLFQPARANIEGAEEVLVLGAQSCQNWTRAVQEDMHFFLHTVPIAFDTYSQLVGDSVVAYGKAQH